MTAHDLIEWSDDLMTGVAEIDEQHRILVNSINEANTRLSNEQVNLAILEKITKDLLSYGSSAKPRHISRKRVRIAIKYVA